MRLLLLAVLAASACSSISNRKRTLSSRITGQDIWNDYRRAPDRHPNIPNVSYAGYRSSEVPLPRRPVVVNVRTWAKGNGTTDDTGAFNRAVETAFRLGGGAVLIPAGRYLIRGMLRLTRSGVVLRGEGEKTVLYFENPLSKILDPRSPESYPGEAGYSWLGGLIHAGPATDFDSEGKIVSPEFPQSWDYGDTICKLLRPADRGDRDVFCDAADAASLKAGQWVFLRWKNTYDHSLLNEIAGVSDFPWVPVPEFRVNGKNLLSLKAWRWPVQIEKVEGGRVRLKQPLRLPVRPEWETAFQEMGSFVEDVGVEDLTLEMKRHPFEQHNSPAGYSGYSGIYFNKVINGWVRNVRFLNTDNAFIGSAIKSVTVRDIEIDGAPRPDAGGNKPHHGTVLRAGSHDNLISNFVIRTPVVHGINVEGLSSGNVWRLGLMEHGTFDSHRRMPFDMIRTSIRVHNDGEPGGAKEAGPANGVRVVHWNVQVSQSGRSIYQPDQISSGALVGIRGVGVDTSPAEAMSHGTKGTLVSDDGVEPVPQDLFRAQLGLRLGRDPCEIVGCEGPL